MPAATGEDIAGMMARAIETMPHQCNPGPLRFYAAGPNVEAWARKHLNPGIEIVRMDRLP